MLDSCVHYATGVRTSVQELASHFDVKLSLRNAYLHVAQSDGSFTRFPYIAICFPIYSFPAT